VTRLPPAAGADARSERRVELRALLTYPRISATYDSATLASTYETRARGRAALDQREGDRA
jgi:hypothetical protein